MAFNKCPKCGRTITSNDNFCPDCGNLLTITCKSCGYSWRFWKSHKYCPKCGEPVQKE